MAGVEFVVLSCLPSDPVVLVLLILTFPWTSTTRLPLLTSWLLETLPVSWGLWLPPSRRLATPFTLVLPTCFESTACIIFSNLLIKPLKKTRPRTNACRSPVEKLLLVETSHWQVTSFLGWFLSSVRVWFMVIFYAAFLLECLWEYPPGPCQDLAEIKVFPAMKLGLSCQIIKYSGALLKPLCFLLQDLVIVGYC